jgi:hypothetical protein
VREYGTEPVLAQQADQSGGVALVKRLCGTAAGITCEKLEDVRPYGKGALPHRKETLRRGKMTTYKH